MASLTRRGTSDLIHVNLDCQRGTKDEATPIVAHRRAYFKRRGKATRLLQYRRKYLKRMASGSSEILAFGSAVIAYEAAAIVDIEIKAWHQKPRAAKPIKSVARCQVDLTLPKFGVLVSVLHNRD